MSKVVEGQNRYRNVIAKAVDRNCIFIVGKRWQLTRVLVDGEYYEVPDTRLERLRAGESPAHHELEPAPDEPGSYYG